MPRQAEGWAGALVTKETLQPDREGPGPPWNRLPPVPTASSSQAERLDPWGQRFPTGWAQAWEVGSRVWEFRTNQGPLFSLWFSAYEPNRSLLGLLNPLATSQSRQVLLPEPFITPIPGCAQQWRSLESRGRGSPLLGAWGLGMRP